MKTIYTAYTKLINGSTFYFVKKFATFPDLKDLPDVLEGYGMHTDFNQACIIAGVVEKELREQLFKEMKDNGAKVIEMNVVRSITATNS